MKFEIDSRTMNYYRPSWDDYFLALARLVATRSTCDRLQAGAVLVKDKRILSTGYNGSPAGLPHCDGEVGHKLEDGHCIRTLHAEENTLLQMAALGGMSTNRDTLMRMLYSSLLILSWTTAPRKFFKA